MPLEFSLGLPEFRFDFSPFLVPPRLIVLDRDGGFDRSQGLFQSARSLVEPCHALVSERQLIVTNIGFQSLLQKVERFISLRWTKQNTQSPHGVGIQGRILEDLAQVGFDFRVWDAQTLFRIGSQ